MSNTTRNIIKSQDLISMHLGTQNAPMLLVFDAQWSSTSSMTDIISTKIVKEANNLKLVKIDIDQEEDLASKYRIRKVPTCLLIVNNEMKYRHEGLFSKSMVLQELKKI